MKHCSVLHSSSVRSLHGLTTARPTARHSCDLAGVVPFRPNTMLVFLNSRGAHGATIPGDAPGETERYTYQFCVAPENAALGALIRELPAERRTMWQNRNRLTSSSREA
jgi:hypothetical protein